MFQGLPKPFYDVNNHQTTFVNKNTDFINKFPTSAKIF